MLPNLFGEKLFQHTISCLSRLPNQSISQSFLQPSPHRMEDVFSSKIGLRV